jgi:ferredoxin
VAIIGGGLSGLTAAYDLARKGYPVTVFEATAGLGGQLGAFPPEILPPAIRQAELEQVARLGGDIRLNSALGREVSLAQLTAEFDAVYLGAGPGMPADQGLTIDPFTLSAGIDKVFAGGSLLRPGNYSAIESMADGRRAAVSIDRLCQRVSLTAARSNEGAYPPRLHTSPVGIEPRPLVPPIDPATGYSPAEAIAEAGRCLQCECLECVKVCPYLEHYGSYPKRYAREIYNNLSIVMGTRLSNKLINSCSLCGLCTEVCPTDFSMADLCRQSRQAMVPKPHARLGARFCPARYGIQQQRQIYPGPPRPRRARQRPALFPRLPAQRLGAALRGANLRLAASHRSGEKRGGADAALLWRPRRVGRSHRFIPDRSG